MTRSFTFRCQGAALALLFVLLAGCAANDAPGTTLYTLPVSPWPGAAAGESRVDETVVIGRVDLPRYLSNEGIVMQLSEVEVQQARNHIWAGALSQQLKQALQQHLTAALPHARVLQGGPQSRASDTLWVDLELTAFQGHYDGKAVVRGAWQIRRSAGEALSRQSFAVEQTLGADGYPALVKALARAWAEVAARLADDLERQQGKEGGGDK